MLFRSPIYGARPIKRYIQKEIETPLSIEIIKGNITSSCNISVKNDEFIIQK